MKMKNKAKIVLIILALIDLLLLTQHIIVELKKQAPKAPKQTKGEPIYFSTLEPTATPMRIILMEAEATATPEPTAEPTAEPIPEPTEEPKEEWITILATSYSSRPEENGGFGAVDCKYGKALPENAVAANLEQFPYGTRLYIEGIGERIVVDTASNSTIEKMEAMASRNNCEGWLDIYAGDDYEGAKQFGIKKLCVRIIKE